MATTRRQDRHHAWLDLLEDEDLGFLKRFLLLSGSLKELARAYEVSYPTVRLRLDRLIQKVQIADQFGQEQAGPFERQLRALLADGALDSAAFKKLREAHLEEIESSTPTNP
ncbi:MAG: DUF2089 family protein [Verrucomicrobiae bacterium]|nr:DUF2089 family protein [Verrucomicrobiae bacterium]MCP5539527.1 DUF2089 family protein [Akkermansiaceae bacterium]MCP5550074.1 DUF2089 family protein [Akkermansiaceae bacterium]